MHVWRFGSYFPRSVAVNKSITGAVFLIILCQVVFIKIFLFNFKKHDYKWPNCIFNYQLGK